MLLFKVKQEWDHHPSMDNLISENVRTCIDKILQPEPRKRWTIENILESDWITMNRGLIEMNEQETLALINAQNTNKTENQKHFKKIKANRSVTQHILDKQLPTFFSDSQKIELISNRSKECSKSILKP